MLLYIVSHHIDVHSSSLRMTCIIIIPIVVVITIGGVDIMGQCIHCMTKVGV